MSAGILLQGGAEEGFAGQEHHDKFRGRFELLPVAISRQARACDRALGARGRDLRAADFVVGGFDRFEVRLQRSLGVDYDILVAGQLHDQVGTQAAVAGVDRDLLVEIAVGLHAGDFDHALQLDFSPTAANRWRAQSFHQIAGFCLQRFLRADQRLHLLGERAVSLAAVFFHLLNLAVNLVERVLDGGDQILDCLLAGLEIAFGLALKSLQAGFGEMQKRLVIAFQGFGGEGLEGFAEFFAGAIDQIEFFGRTTSVRARAWIAGRRPAPAGGTGPPAAGRGLRGRRVSPFPSGPNGRLARRCGRAAKTKQARCQTAHPEEQRSLVRWPLVIRCV